MPEYHFSNLVMDFSRHLEILKENDFFNKKKKKQVGCHSSVRELGETIFQYLYLLIHIKSFRKSFNSNMGSMALLSIESERVGWGYEILRSGAR